jgi:hypothetical protein
MRLVERASKRYRGPRVLFEDDLASHKSEVEVEGGDTPTVCVKMCSERRYRLDITPEEVLTFLFTLPPNSIANAVVAVGQNVDLSMLLPETLKQLATGAIPKKE